MSSKNNQQLIADNQQLKEKLFNLQTLIDNTPALIYINEIEDSKNINTSQCTWSNQYGYNIMGYAQEEVNELGFDYYRETMHPDDLNVADRSLEILNNSKGGTVFKGFGRAKPKGSDSYLWLNVRTIVYKRNEDGSPRQYLNVAIDLSEQMHSDPQLAGALQEIHRLNNELKLKSISKRETEVLKLIAKGYTNREIADQFFVSIKTVKTHRNNLIKKLNAKNTAMLVALAVEFGLG